MQSSLFRRWIIGLALVTAALAGGCTMALKLGYNQGPTLAYWWMNGYADFDGPQAQRVKQLIGLWFRWNRTEQLPDYQQLMERAQTQVLQPVLTGPQMCAFSDEVKQRVRTAYEHAVPSLAEVALSLSPEQLASIEKRFDKNNRKFRDEFLPARREARVQAQVKKVEERLKTVYGSVTDAQHQRVVQLVSASPYDPELWLAERQLLQQQVLQQLRQLQAAKAAGTPDAALAAQAQQALRELARVAEHSPREAYRQQQQRVAAYQCAMTAELHGLMSPAQRQAAHQKIGRWVEDLQALHAGR